MDIIKGKIINYQNLFLLEGEKVIVSDLEYDEYDQICTVKIQEFANIIKNKIFYYKTIKLVNEEYLFEFDKFGKCKNGKFLVYYIRSRYERTI